MVSNSQKIIQKIIDHYGEDEQFRQCAEECCELAIALNKWMRYHTVQTYDNVIEEIADVEITIAEVKKILNIKNEDIIRLKSYKLQRTLERIENDLSGMPEQG